MTWLSSTVVITNLEATPGSNTAAITWTTQVPADSIVYYGLTTSYGSMATGNSNTTHSVSLTNLTTNTVYHFSVTSTSGTNIGSSGDNAFLTLGAPANTNPISFVTVVSAGGMVAMNVSTGMFSTVTWFWGDGVTNSLPSHIFTNPGTYTNYVVVNPAIALQVFGIECDSGTPVSSVNGLTNYPNLEDLFFFNSGLSLISLAGCSNLVHIALAGCNVTSGMEDGWFTNLANAEPTMPVGQSAYCDGYLHYFFYPTNSSVQPTTNSAAARAHLTANNWILFPAQY